MTTLIIILLVALAAAAVAGFIHFRAEKTPGSKPAIDPMLEIRATVGECRAVADDLDGYGRRSDYRNAVGSAILRLADIIREIADNTAKDPRDLEVARGLDGLLEKLMGIVVGYDTLKTRIDEGEDVQSLLEKTGKQIVGFVPHFEELRKACLDNDTDQLEIQAKVLKSILDFEAPTHGVKA